MSRTLSGELTGRAARIDRADRQQYIEDQARQARADALHVREHELYLEMRSLDPNGEAWFDDDANVPEFGTRTQRIQILEKRIAELRSRPLLRSFHFCNLQCIGENVKHVHVGRFMRPSDGALSLRCYRLVGRHGFDSQLQHMHPKAIGLQDGLSLLFEGRRP